MVGRFDPLAVLCLVTDVLHDLYGHELAHRVLWEGVIDHLGRHPGAQ